MHPPICVNLEWGISYRSMLGAKSNDHAVHKLEAAHLGRDFAKNAVRVLSSHPNPVAGIDLRPRVALAGLIVMVCESARMNPPHDSFSRGWSTGTGFAKQLMIENFWEHGKMSSKLMAWKTRGYASNVSTQNWQPHPIMELQTVRLVLRTHTPDQSKQEENKKSQHSKPDNAGNDGDYYSNKPGNNGGGGGPPRQSRGGHNAGGGDDTGSSGGGYASQPREAGGAGSSGGSASQPAGEAGDTSPSRGNSGSQPGELDVRSHGNGRPRVELLAIRADLHVKGTEIVVFDGRRGQIIYRKEEGEEETEQVYIYYVLLICQLRVCLDPLL